MLDLRMLLVLVQVCACMCVRMCALMVQIRKRGSPEEVKGVDFASRCSSEVSL